MATFHDEREQEELQADEELVSLEQQEELVEEAEAEEPEAVEEEQEQPEEDIPDKYKGKSVQEIIKMHRESEKMISRHGEELGNLRKLVDETLTANLAKNNAPEEQPEEELDFFSDPDKYLEAKMANHPTLKAAEETALTLKRNQVLAQLEQTHPDYMDVVQNEEFQKWVSDSNIRTEMFNRASNNFEYEPADELLSYWKERQKVVGEAVETSKAERKEARKKAATGTAKGSGESPSRKIYRRDDLVNLLKNDPDRYMAMSDEIMQAYAEKRVR